MEGGKEVKNLLLTTDMREAFKRGDKTHTRSLSGLDVVNENPNDWEISKWEGEYTRTFEGAFQFIDTPRFRLKAVLPKYRVGEVVFCGEPYCYESDSFAVKPRIRYKTGGIKEVKPEDIPIGVTIYNYLSENYPGCIRWRSPLSMPAWAARIHARITSVDCGRLHDMTWEDCIAEGIIFEGNCYWVSEYVPSFSIAREAFAFLWDKINPKHKWETNSWVFDYGIERVEL